VKPQRSANAVVFSIQMISSGDTVNYSMMADGRKPQR